MYNTVTSSTMMSKCWRGQFIVGNDFHEYLCISLQNKEILNLVWTLCLLKEYAQLLPLLLKLHNSISFQGAKVLLKCSAGLSWSKNRELTYTVSLFNLVIIHWHSCSCVFKRLIFHLHLIWIDFMTEQNHVRSFQIR